MPCHPLSVLDTGPGEPSWNMALDEALLVDAVPRARALLRFYGWTEPAATFGYSQRHAEVECRTRLRPLLRRPTGGGIVSHDRDWTYSLSVPPEHPWYALTAIESYRTMHAWVVEAFRRLGVPAELAATARQEAPGQCFVGWERFDVLSGGRKIAGAAQRRNRLGLLIQGSVQSPSRHDRSLWQAAMIDAVPNAYFAGNETVTLEARVAETAAELDRTRYRQAAYHTRR